MHYCIQQCTQGSVASLLGSCLIYRCQRRSPAHVAHRKITMKRPQLETTDVHEIFARGPKQHSGPGYLRTGWVPMGSRRSGGSQPTKGLEDHCRCLTSPLRTPPNPILFRKAMARPLEFHIFDDSEKFPISFRKHWLDDRLKEFVEGRSSPTRDLGSSNIHEPAVTPPVSNRV